MCMTNFMGNSFSKLKLIITKAVKWISFHIIFSIWTALLNGILSQFDFDIHNLNTYEQPNLLSKTKWFLGPWWLNIRAFGTNWLRTKSFINVKNKRIPYKWFKLLSTKQRMCCHCKTARQQHDWGDDMVKRQAVSPGTVNHSSWIRTHLCYYGNKVKWGQGSTKFKSDMLRFLVRSDGENKCNDNTSQTVKEHLGDSNVMKYFYCTAVHLGDLKSH